MGAIDDGNGRSRPPTAIRDGAYFRANVSSWHSLAEYIEHVAPDRAIACEHWHSNEGDGLDAEDSRTLATVLDKEIASGRCAEFVRAFEVHQRTVQDEPYEICDGTGFRLPPPDAGAGDQFCNACDGLGQAPAPVRNYRLSVEAVEGFAEFLHECGGFTID